MQYQEILKEIELINNTKFNKNTLRELQILTKKINFYKNQKYLTNIELLNIYPKYKKLIKNKIKEIYPKNHKKLLSNILEVLTQNYNQIPTDITIIDNDIVLLYNTPYDTPIIKDEIKILQSKNYKELQNIQSFKELRNIYLSTKNNLEKNQIDQLFNFYYPDFITDNINRQSILTMINHINMLLKPYNNYLNKSIDYDIQNDNLVYPKNSNMKIFIDKSLEELIIAIFEQKIITFNLVAINEWNEIYSWEIIQHTNKNKQFSWEFNKTNLDIWNLSNSIEKEKVLTKKKIDNK